MLRSNIGAKLNTENEWFTLCSQTDATFSKKTMSHTPTDREDQQKVQKFSTLNSTPSWAIYSERCKENELVLEKKERGLGGKKMNMNKKGSAVAEEK